MRYPGERGKKTEMMEVKSEEGLRGDSGERASTGVGAAEDFSEIGAVLLN